MLIPPACLTDPTSSCVDSTTTVHSSSCTDACPYIGTDGTGRICDETCTNGHPCGTLGCGADDGHYGPNCRVCYTDVDKALEADAPGDRAIL